MSLSDFSDLTDVSSDEDDVPLAKRASKVKKGPKEYKITRVLRAPRTAQYTAKSLYDQIIDNAIDLDPEYQREVVWQEEKQSGLIDSVLRNYYIPPIIFAVTVQDDGSELRTCIDGKQRLTSIQRFIDGQIPHKDSFTNEKLWFKSTAANSRRKLLPQYLRTQFANKQIVCVEYTELNDDQEREIFQRVQLGVALTPAERLQALAGPWSTVIREIQNQVLGEEGFEGYLDWGHARGRDFQCLATIGYLIENHPKIAIPGPKMLEKWLQKAQPVSAHLRNDLHETFRIFVTLARDKKYSGSLNRPTRVSPIEFITIGVLIYLKRQTLSLTQISSAIEKMRKDVRASHQDIRSNTRITKHLMEFMTKKIKVSELKSDGEGDKPAAQAIAKTMKLAKRKRPVYSDDSDMEPASMAKPAKSSTNSVSAGAVKSTKQTPTATDQQPNSTKKSATIPNPSTSLSAKPSQKSGRTTNNSLSNIFPISTPKPPVPPATQPSSSTLNGHDAHSRPTTSNSAQPGPLTIQTGPMVKAESPQMAALKSPAALSAVDRLAPIRAAKASLASGQGTQPPVGKGSEMTIMPGPVTNIPVDPRQNPAVSRFAAHQAGVLSSQQPPPASPALSQPLSASGQGRTLPTQLEEVLRTLRSQYPQLGHPSQSPSNGVANPATSGQNAQVNEDASYMTPASVPGPANTSGVNNSGPVFHGNTAGIPQGTHNQNIPHSQANLNQPPGSYTLPPRPPPNLDMSGNGTSQHQPPSNHPAPTSVGLHPLPQRPVVPANGPRNATRAVPLGPSRSGSSDGAIQDGRRGPYNKDRHRPPDDRRSNRYDRSHDFDRDGRKWPRSRT